MMHIVHLPSETDFAAWRQAARLHCSKGDSSDLIEWNVGRALGGLFGPLDVTAPKEVPSPDRAAVKTSKVFLDKAQRVICHRDAERFRRLYRLLCRLQETPQLLNISTDLDVKWLNDCDKAVRRDIHKMHAFVRFRFAGRTQDGREQFAAWFEPTHRILELTAPFFKRRFPNMDWLIATPDKTAIWNNNQLSYQDGGQRSDVPAEDALEEHWRTYFSSIFNPARLKVSAMMSEMPKKYWKNLPEAQLIPSLIADAQKRSDTMRARQPTAPNPLSEHLATRASSADKVCDVSDFEQLKIELNTCDRCPLSECATQAVPGKGPASAKLMIIGEQPGDQEDITGQPFVGPAGQLLDKALLAAGIDRQGAYVTNAVKHFKFRTRGKHRLHVHPSASEIDHCRWWLDIERARVQPKLILALGATAIRAITGRSTPVKQLRGQPTRLAGGSTLLTTVHPAHLLRTAATGPDQPAFKAFVDDLSIAARLLSDVKAA